MGNIGNGLFPAQTRIIKPKNRCEELGNKNI